MAQTYEYGPFTYKVSFWCDVKKKLVQECGLLFAKSWVDAVEILQRQYDLDCIDHLQGWEPDDVVVLSEYTMNRIESGKDLEDPIPLENENLVSRVD